VPQEGLNVNGVLRGLGKGIREMWPQMLRCILHAVEQRESAFLLPYGVGEGEETLEKAVGAAIHLSYRRAASETERMGGGRVSPMGVHRCSWKPGLMCMLRTNSVVLLCTGLLDKTKRRLCPGS